MILFLLILIVCISIIIFISYWIAKFILFFLNIFAVEKQVFFTIIATLIISTALVFSLSYLN